jgi:hypothetical protein
MLEITYEQMASSFHLLNFGRDVSLEQLLADKKTYGEKSKVITPYLNKLE